MTVTTGATGPKGATGASAPQNFTTQTVYGAKSFANGSLVAFNQPHDAKGSITLNTDKNVFTLPANSSYEISFGYVNNVTITGTPMLQLTLNGNAKLGPPIAIPITASPASVNIIRWLPAGQISLQVAGGTASFNPIGGGTALFFTIKQL